jgi:hypothetical protein
MKKRKDQCELDAIKTAKYFVVLANIKGYKKYDRKEIPTLQEALEEYHKSKSLLYAVDQWGTAECIQSPAVKEIVNNLEDYVTVSSQGQ